MRKDFETECAEVIEIKMNGEGTKWLETPHVVSYQMWRGVAAGNACQGKGF